MMGVRKIYVEEDELVEIRLVPKGYDKSASSFNEWTRPESHKFMARIGSNYIDLPVVGNFVFMMGGKLWEACSRRT